MNDIATEHYNITLYEIEQGTSITHLRLILKDKVLEKCLSKV